MKQFAEGSHRNWRKRFIFQTVCGGQDAHPQMDA